MDDKLVRLIWLQAGLERHTGVTLEERVRYVSDQRWELACRLGEVGSEVSDAAIHRDELVGKLVAALPHWINLILAVSGNATPREVADEIFTRFALQHHAAAQRLESGEKSE